jgi:two-component SAPR family response regulator
MSRLEYTARIASRALAALILLIVLVLAWGLRPTLPQLPHSLTAPLAINTIERFATLLTWVTAIGYLLSLFGRALRAIVNLSRPAPLAQLARLKRALRHPAAAPGPPRLESHLAPIRPYVLTIPRRAEPPAARAVTQATATTVATAPDQEPEPSPSTTRSISLLGPLRIQGARQPGRRLRSATAELLLYLVLHREGATIEKIADTLTPDVDPKRAKARLWKSVTEARRVLGDAFQRDDDGRYRLDRCRVAIDTDRLDRLLARADQAPDQATRSEILEHALGLFRDEPLAGADYPWAEGEIRRLRASYAELLEQAGRARLAAGNPRGALDAAERGMRVDELNEALWQLAMQAEATLGLRDAVKRRYEQLYELLDRELGLKPAAETRTFYHKLLGQE